MGVRNGMVQSGGTLSSDARDGAQARPRLLVVEDDPNIVELLSASLRFAGFDVTAATNGADAVSAARDVRPDLVVLDVMLPDLDGFEVIRRMREGGVRTPVVFLTAKIQFAERRELGALGAAGILTKPFDPLELASDMATVLHWS